MRFFSIDGKFAQTMTKVYDLVALNLMVIATSLPVITSGASLTALYSVTLKMAKDQESYIWKSYWKEWKRNIRQASCIWLIFLAFGAFLAVDFFLVRSMGGASAVMLYFLGIMIFLWIMALSYVFPVLAKFDNRVNVIIKNAVLMSIRHLPWTLLILIINLLPGGLALLLPGLMGAVISFFIFLIGFSGTALLCSCIFSYKIFPCYTGSEE